MLKLYHRLPPPAQTLACSLRGFYLRYWRYSAETEDLVEQALRREYWSAEEWRSWQEQRLAYLLDHAVTAVPYYRQLWAQRRRNGDRSSSELLENWPVLEKERLRENPTHFVADGVDINRLFHDHTSGTTGKPLDIWASKQTLRSWYALFEARSRRWYGVSRHDRWAMIGGQLITPIKRRQPPFWVWNAGLKQLYMSSYHLAPETIPHYIDAMLKYRVEYLVGYTSSLYEVAQEAIRLGRRDLQLKVVITNAEPLYKYQREAIQNAFQCQVRETYGMSELAAAAGECEAGRMHWWPEVAHHEIVDQDSTQGFSVTGELITTGMLNADMPLIRYRVGDRCEIPTRLEPCACGRTLPLLNSIDGRADDLLYTSDGRRIGRLDPVFKTRLPVREAQIIQETFDRVRVRYVPAINFNAAAANSITQALRERMGEIEVILEAVDQVPRGANGKFRAVICQISSEQLKTVNDREAAQSAVA